ncbi:MAG: HAD-IIIC family phosphatase [Salinivirgaceae bacterium]
MKTLKIAILGDSATQLIRKFLQAKSTENDLQLEIYEADFNQIEQQILNTNSELYRLKPDFVIVFQSSQQLLYQFQTTNTNTRLSFAENFINHTSNLIQTINTQLNCKILWNNFYEINDSIFGNYTNKTANSFLSQQRKINLSLSELCGAFGNLYLYDLSSGQNKIGATAFIDWRLYYLSKMALSIDGMQAMVNEIAAIIKALNGHFKKCLILDLDNTLWGGVIGDDGLENIQIGDLGIGKAFSDIQLWAKDLKNRGVLLAICSKNNEEIAKDPFLKHPDMVLKLDDIAIFMANWNNKVDNIRHIQNVLNIGFDSMVFIDDNPFERNMVRETLHEITVPELPDDPTEYLTFLRGLNLFETTSVSQADSERTQQYQTEAKRIKLKTSFSNEADYLKSLNMICQVSTLNPYLIPRVAQLTQRSNQFNLRTQRYNEQQMQQMHESEEFEIFTFSLSDKFGDYGLVSVVILQKQETNLFVDTWIMSCRVLKRGLELFVLDRIVKFARENDFTTIIAEYLPTTKNQLVEKHYENLGFSEFRGKWFLPINAFSGLQYFIKEK